MWPPSFAWASHIGGDAPSSLEDREWGSLCIMLMFYHSQCFHYEPHCLELISWLFQIISGWDVAQSCASLTWFCFSERLQNCSQPFLRIHSSSSSHLYLHRILRKKIKKIVGYLCLFFHTVSALYVEVSEINGNLWGYTVNQSISITGDFMFKGKMCGTFNTNLIHPWCTQDI